MHIQIWLIWAIVGLALVVIEMFTTGFIFAVFGIGCIMPAILSGLGFGIEIQAIGFLIFTVVVGFFVRPIAIKFLYQNNATLKTNLDAIVNQKAFVTERIDFSAGSGRVRVEGELWKAASSDHSVIIEVGQQVRVVGISGCTVIVSI